MAKSAIAWNVKRIVRKPFSRLLDKHSLKKANQTARKNRSSLDISAEHAHVLLNRMNAPQGIKNPEEYRHIAHVFNLYFQSNRAERDLAKQKGNSKRVERFDQNMKYLRKKIREALQGAAKAEKLLEQKRKKMGFD